jgi:hypothetical protein
MVGHTSTSSYTGSGGRKIVVQGWPGESRYKTLSKKQKQQGWRYGSNSRMPSIRHRIQSLVLPKRKEEEETILITLFLFAII